ncbi:class I SAM-dependent methyltransferase [Stenotrophomonas sp. STM01]|uniref:class I SAM-dependent methyltransferase n=1 Tax=Stenotrophomonas sp. STM01 TaxID=2769278 RepID=UPI00178478A0|nr:class I SAM-dependent methyltransferase [Stenotrophomonas sp. STM01]MBD9537694.1 class I SAM-dependent methyltransferase [Stenotrophomonas sp. STM01]
MLDTPTLAAQLRHPHGAPALAVAESMNRSNGALNRTAIALLAVQANEHVLEIGPGNAAFAPLLLSAPGSRYLGVELSSAMVHAGNRLLRDQGLADRARLQTGDAQALAVGNGGFDAALAVNTLYFWPDLPGVLAQLAAALRPGGRLCLAFGDATFMRTLPFTAHGFHLYERTQVEHALHASGFPTWRHQTHAETGTSNAGSRVDKQFHLLLARRG